MTTSSAGFVAGAGYTVQGFCNNELAKDIGNAPRASCVCSLVASVECGAIVFDCLVKGLGPLKLPEEQPADGQVPTAFFPRPPQRRFPSANSLRRLTLPFFASPLLAFALTLAHAGPRQE